MSMTRQQMREVLDNPNPELVEWANEQIRSGRYGYVIVPHPDPTVTDSFVAYCLDMGETVGMGPTPEAALEALHVQMLPHIMGQRQYRVDPPFPMVLSGYVFGQPINLQYLKEAFLLATQEGMAQWKLELAAIRAGETPASE